MRDLFELSLCACNLTQGGLAERPRVELRLGVNLGRISNPLGYRYPTAPYKTPRPKNTVCSLIVFHRDSRPSMTKIHTNVNITNGVHWRQAEVSLPILSLVPLVFKTRFGAVRINLPYLNIDIRNAVDYI